MQIGSISSSSNSSYWGENARRMVFYQFPNGAATLTGLLSMMDSVRSPYPEFGYWEQRQDPFASTTAQANSAGPFTTNADVDKTEAGWTATDDTTIRVYVEDASQFRERDIVKIIDVPSTTVDFDMYLRVTDVDTSNNHITGKLNSAVTLSALNTTAANGLDIVAIGTAAAEGATSRSGGITRPIELTNYTQIFRTAFSLTGTALQVPLNYDASGDYKNMLKENGLRHSIMLERAMLFGQRSKHSVTNDHGEVVPERKTGGIEWYLQQWEKGTVSNGAMAEYRPGGSDITSSDWTTTSDKRIVKANGTITANQFDTLIERLFQRTGDMSNEKLCLCGSTFMNAFSKYVRGSSLARRELFSNGKAGFDYWEWESPMGTVFFKTHPLLNETSFTRGDAFFLDMGYLHYTYLTDRDTQIKKNIQANDADLRRDEFRTEAGLELKFPEAHMLVKGLTGITI